MRRGSVWHSLIEETFGLVQACEADLARETRENAVYLGSVGRAVEDHGHAYVYCSAACRSWIYEIGRACRLVETRRRAAQQSVVRSLAPPSAVPASTSGCM